MLANADANSDMTTEQEARLTAIKAELAQIETERCAAEDALTTPADLATAVAAATEAATALATKRAADIAGACELAGKPKAAHDFIVSGKNADEVVEALKADAAIQKDVNTHRGVSRPDQAASWDKAIDRVNARIKT